MPKVKQEAFAAVYEHAKQPHIMIWTISGTASLVRSRVGKQWCAEDPKEGWKAARIEGVKVVKIAMTSVQ